MTKRKKSTAGGSTPAVNSKEVKPVVDTAVVDETVVDETVVDTAVVDETVEGYLYNGKHYTLVHYVKRLQVNGVVYPREKLLTNEEIMTTLIVGNSPFIKKV